MAEAKIAKA
jgi:small nuclear ribonucleoprotein (snRNP)-like protein